MLGSFYDPDVGCDHTSPHGQRAECVLGVDEQAIFQEVDVFSSACRTFGAKTHDKGFLETHPYQKML